MKRFLLLFAAGVALTLSGCGPIGLAASAGAGLAYSATREGGVSGTLSDARIQAEINDLWFRYNVETFSKLDLTVRNGRVLITGIVQNPDHRVEAVRLAWQPAGVEQVINEIRIADSDGVKGYLQDSWILTRLRAALVMDKDIQSLNYSLDSVQGTVYIMGVANSRAELDKVTETARMIPYVKQVVSYVKLPGEPDGLSR